MKTAVRANTRPSVSSTVVVDDEPSHLAAHDLHSSCFELRLLGFAQVVRVDEEGDIVGPLPNEVRVLDRAAHRPENPEGLVADLPAVAVRAVQEISAPPLANPGDLGQLVQDTRRDQDPPRVQHAPTGEADDEPGVDRDHPIVDQHHAVAGRLGASGGQERGRRHPVAGQEPLHVARSSVSRRTGIDDRDPTPCPTEHESRTRAGRTPAHHHHVVTRHLADRSAARSHRFGPPIAPRTVVSMTGSTSASEMRPLRNSALAVWTIARITATCHATGRSLRKTPCC
jgi:hypothetical protein